MVTELLGEKVANFILIFMPLISGKMEGKDENSITSNGTMVN